MISNFFFKTYLLIYDFLKRYFYFSFLFYEVQLYFNHWHNLVSSKNPLVVFLSKKWLNESKVEQLQFANKFSVTRNLTWQFHPDWMALIIHGVYWQFGTLSCSVLVNGEPNGLFNPSRTRDFCQGDPVSPYLFLLCTKNLILLLSK